jgi:hypothetical protein
MLAAVTRPPSIELRIECESQSITIAIEPSIDCILISWGWLAARPLVGDRSIDRSIERRERSAPVRLFALFARSTTPMRLLAVLVQQQSSKKINKKGIDSINTQKSTKKPHTNRSNPPAFPKALD